MKGMALLSAPNVRVLDELPLAAVPDLLELQRHLNGGYIERVPGFTSIEHRGEVRRCIAFCDEDGKMKGLPINHYATILWKFACQRLKPDETVTDRLCGSVLIIYGDDELMSKL
jgi:hypothetical protein